MDPTWDSWSQSPSGSGAQETWQEENPFENLLPDAFATGVDTPGDFVELEAEEAALSANVFGASELAPGQVMSTKIPPAWSGQGSWFAIEELVDDWTGNTTFTGEKQGPAFKNRLKIELAVCMSTLDRSKLKMNMKESSTS